MTKQYRKSAVLATKAALFIGIASTVSAGGTDNENIKDLERLVQRQQQQIDVQASEIEALKEMLHALLGQTEQNKTAIAAKADKQDLQNIHNESLVLSKNPKVDVSLYGQLNRAGLWADNGDSSKVYFVDNIFSSTRMGVDAVARATDDLNIGGKLEYEIISNSSLEVNQDEQDSSASLKLRHADAFVDSKTLGKFFLGQGSTSTDSTAERDLSGTTVVAYSAVQFQAGGQKWYDTATNAVSNLQVKSVIDNMDGLGRRDRIRYDTPSFAGFQFSGSAIESGAFDSALSYSRKFGDTTVAAALGYAAPGDLAVWDNQYDGSFSILFENGLNLTLAGGIQENDIVNRNNPNYWYGKLGYKASLFPLGTLAFAVDYGLWNDFDRNENEAKSFGLAFVQDIADWGTEFYFAYRLYTLDSPGADFDDINTVMSGARIKF